MKYSKLLDYYISHTREKELMTQKVIELTEPDKSMTLLDLGCGNGAVTIPLSRMVTHTVAVDQDSTILDALRKATSRPSIDFVRSRIESFQTEQKFDIILMAYVLYGITDWMPLIERTVQRLTPTGKLIIVHGGTTTFDKERFFKLAGHVPGDTAALRRDLVAAGIPYTEDTYSTHIRTPDLEEAFQICSIFLSAVHEKYFDMEREIKAHLQTLYVGGEYHVTTTDQIIIIDARDLGE